MFWQEYTFWDVFSIVYLVLFTFCSPEIMTVKLQERAHAAFIKLNCSRNREWLLGKQVYNSEDAIIKGCPRLTHTPPFIYLSLPLSLPATCAEFAFFLQRTLSRRHLGPFRAWVARRRCQSESDSRGFGIDSDELTGFPESQSRPRPASPPSLPPSLTRS